MEAIIYKRSDSTEELLQILALQRANIEENIATTEAIDQGFVTVKHDFSTLEAMNIAGGGHIIAKKGNEVVGYALVMPRSFGDKIEVLKPMFQMFESITYQDRPLSSYSYIVMGQICVDKSVRGQGVFAGLYNCMAKQLKPQFDIILTEIAARNTRSMRAHEKVGFKTIHAFKDDYEDWRIVLLAI